MENTVKSSTFCHSLRLRWVHLLLLYNRKGTRFSLPFLCSNYLFPGAHYGKCGKHFIDSGHHLQQYSSYSGIWQTEEGKRKRSI